MKRCVATVSFAISALFLWPGCGEDSSKTEEHTVVDTTKSTPPDTTYVMNTFVSDAAEGGMMEVELSKLAQSNGASEDVKEFGKMLETDHAAANAELRSIAAAGNIPLPARMSEEHSKHVKAMGEMKGADFDKHFITMMVEDHDKDVAAFKDAAANNPNQQVKDFAAKTLPTLQKHLDKAKAIKSKMK